VHVLILSFSGKKNDYMLFYGLYYYVIDIDVYG